MDIELLKRKLRELMEINPDNDYTYINEPLTEQEVSAFEVKNNIKLPSDYRIFITTMFDGGFGPNQIMPLKFWDSIHNTVYLDSLGNDLSKPFPLKDKTNFEDDFDKSLLENNTTVLDGTIRICHIGSGNFIFLVVNGSEYGNLWIDDTASNDEMLPLTSRNKNRVTFQDWYFDWIDESIRYHKEQITLYKKIIDDENKIEIRASFKEDGSLMIDNFFSDISDLKIKEYYKEVDLGNLNIVLIDKNETLKLFDFYNTQDRMSFLKKIKESYNDEKTMLNFKSFLLKQKIKFN